MPKTSWLITTVIFRGVFACSNKAGKTTGKNMFTDSPQSWNTIDDMGRLKNCQKRRRNKFASQDLNPDSCQYRVCYDHLITGSPADLSWQPCRLESHCENEQCCRSISFYYYYFVLFQKWKESSLNFTRWLSYAVLWTIWMIMLCHLSRAPCRHDKSAPLNRIYKM